MSGALVCGRMFGCVDAGMFGGLEVWSFGKVSSSALDRDGSADNDKYYSNTYYLIASRIPPGQGW